MCGGGGGGGPSAETQALQNFFFGFDMRVEAGCFNTQHLGQVAHGRSRISFFAEKLCCLSDYLFLARKINHRFHSLHFSDFKVNN